MDTRALWNTRYARSAAGPPPADPWLARGHARLAPAREGVILELGCGDGRTTRALAALGCRHLVVADLAEEGLRRCRQAVPAAMPVQLDLRHPLPFPDACCRAVVASLCLHYFPWQLTLAIVGEIRRCLAPDGLLFARFNSTRDTNHGAAGHPELEPHFQLVQGEPKRFFDHADLTRLFAAGWRLDAVEEMTIATRSLPKVLWEVVAEKQA